MARCQLGQAPTTDTLCRLRGKALIRVALCHAILLAFLLAPRAGGQLPQRLIQGTRDLLISPGTGDFSYIGSMAIARGGIIVVTQPQDNTVRFYSPTGKLLGNFGRSGGGPAEFRYLGFLGRIADSLWVPDMNLRRVTLFSADRRYLGSRMLPSALVFKSQDGTQVTFSSPYPRAIYPDGSLLVRGSGGRATNASWPPRPHAAGEYPYLRSSEDGAVERIIGWAASSWFCDGPPITIPFCAEPLEAIASDGKLIAGATTNVLASGAGRVRITMLNDDGDTVFARTIEVSLERIPREVRDSVRRAKARNASSPALRSAIMDMDIPDFYPPLENLLVGEDGSAWIELRSRTSERVWLVLAADGTMIGRLQLPREVSVKVAQRDRIWGVIESIDGELGIVRYVLR